MLPIVHRAASVPDYALPIGANFALSVLVGEAFDLDGTEARVKIAPKGQERGWEISSEDADSALEINGQTVTVNAAPSNLGTIGTPRTLQSVQQSGECVWSLDVLTGGEVSFRIQGNLTFLQRGGSIEGNFGEFPEIEVSVNVDETIEVILSMPGGESSGGDVVGPAESVANNFAAFDGTTGKLIKDSASNAGSFEPSGAISTHSGATTGVHGISVFGATLVDDADADAALVTLTGGASGIPIFKAATLAAARLELGIRSIRTTGTVTATDQTPVAVPQLTFSVAAGKRYFVEFWFYLSASASSAHQIRVTYPSGSMVVNFGNVNGLYRGSPKTPLPGATFVDLNTNTTLASTNGTHVGAMTLEPPTSGNVEFSVFNFSAGSYSTNLLANSGLLITEL
jgi:hypothetical protein